MHSLMDELLRNVERSATERWVGASLGSVLGLANVRAALSRLPPDVRMLELVRGQHMVTLNDRGVALLMLSSRTPAVREAVLGVIEQFVTGLHQQ